MSLGESKGGLPPDSVVEDEDAILRESVRLIEQYHDPNPGAFTRVVPAPSRWPPSSPTWAWPCWKARCTPTTSPATSAW
jgi:hypothetical protein